MNKDWEERKIREFMEEENDDDGNGGLVKFDRWE